LNSRRAGKATELGSTEDSVVTTASISAAACATKSASSLCTTVSGPTLPRPTIADGNRRGHEANTSEISVNRFARRIVLSA
jgi:hypothetical protein